MAHTVFRTRQAFNFCETLKLCKIILLTEPLHALHVLSTSNLTKSSESESKFSSEECFDKIEGRQKEKLGNKIVFICKLCKV